MKIFKQYTFPRKKKYNNSRIRNTIKVYKNDILFRHTPDNEEIVANCMFNVGQHLGEFESPWTKTVEDATRAVFNKYYLGIRKDTKDIEYGWFSKEKYSLMNKFIVPKNKVSLKELLISDIKNNRELYSDVEVWCLPRDIRKYIESGSNE